MVAKIVIKWKSIYILAVVTAAWHSSFSQPGNVVHAVSEGDLVEISPQILLVIDVSESMALHNKINEVQSALNYWISFQVPDGVKIGVLQFSWSSTKLLNNLVVMNNINRSQLVQKLPTLAQGETCVGCGLKRAVQILGITETDSAIILFTDVDSSESDEYLQELEDPIEKAGIKLFTIELGHESGLQEIMDLTKLSGGSLYKVRIEDGIHNGIINALENVMTHFGSRSITHAATTTQATSTKVSTLKAVTIRNVTMKPKFDMAVNITLFTERDFDRTVTPGFANIASDVTVVNMPLENWFVTYGLYVGIVIAGLIIIAICIIIAIVSCRRYKAGRHQKGLYRVAKWKTKEPSAQFINLTHIKSCH